MVVGCRDVTSDPLECLADLLCLSEAVSTKYPTKAFFHPADCGLNAFQLLLHQQHHVRLEEAADMHCGTHINT